MSELSEAINEMRNMRESYDQIAGAAEAYNTGKTELAQNITAKGVQASATETLPELAEKVGIIAQTQTILEGGEVMAVQQFGDGALWNLYQVLADMKTRFMGNGDYAALIVCEYYKGYDSLQLQGADGYCTCDGDLYEYASPNHVWHDADNGKANRWVAFLYRNEGARLDITNTAISPRSMYIGGHIGTIEYFINGRLTELVSGVEETDIVDNFLLKNFTQAWNRNVIMRGLTYLGGEGLLSFPIDGVCVIEAENILTMDSNNNENFGTTANALYFPKCKVYGTWNGSDILYAINAVIFYAPEMHSILNNIGVIFQYSGISANKIQLVYMPKLKICYGKIFTASRSFGTPIDCIDLWVGAMETNLNCTGWNPTNVLADATKKAKLIENIKNHILARVSDATGGTQLVFTVSTNMYNAVANEQIEWQGETMSLADAFLTKNWLLAGA